MEMPWVAWVAWGSICGGLPTEQDALQQALVLLPRVVALRNTEAMPVLSVNLQRFGNEKLGLCLRAEGSYATITGLDLNEFPTLWFWHCQNQVVSWCFHMQMPRNFWRRVRALGGLHRCSLLSRKRSCTESRGRLESSSDIRGAATTKWWPNCRRSGLRSFNDQRPSFVDLYIPYLCIPYTKLWKSLDKTQDQEKIV